MGAMTEIQWADHTFNPWRGCQKVAPGCKNCYAEKLVNGRMQGEFSKKRVRLADAGWREPLRWNRQAACSIKGCSRPAACDGEDGKMCDRHCQHGGRNCPSALQSEKCVAVERPRVFCASLADVFEDWQGPIMNHRGEELAINAEGYIYPLGVPSMLPNGDDWGQREFTMNDLRRDLFALIDATPNLDWLLLTKRPENIRRFLPEVSREVFDWNFDNLPNDHLGVDGGVPCDFFRRNLWLGTSFSDQETADKALPELLACRDLAPVLFGSYEPALGPVDLAWHIVHGQEDTLHDYLTGEYVVDQIDGEYEAGRTASLDWVIAGGESGPHARPFDIAWGRSAIEQCKAAGVPCFMKQVGAKPFALMRECCGEKWCADGGDIECNQCGDMAGLGKLRLDIKHTKGGGPDEWPEDLRVRQFPQVEQAAR